MVLSSKNSAFSSDVCRVFDTPDLRPFSPKYRIGCACRFLSGRPSRCGRKRAIKTLKESAYIYKTMSGRSGWLSRDPIREKGGLNLYGVVENNAINNVDFLGYWKIKRTHGNWALAESEASLGMQDSKESLAKLVRLNYAEFDKWAKPVHGPNVDDCSYYIPNTVIVYTSEQTDEKNENRWPGSWQIANLFRKAAIQNGMAYEAHGYKVLYYLGRSSEATFIILWKTDGIAAYTFGGHGAEESLGFIAAPGSQSAVGPNQVFPPYHLQAIGAYSCFSALDIVHVTPIGPNMMGKWCQLISDQGSFVGYTASVSWLNVWWNEESVNPGIIP